ncbi:MAG: hypothetical protein HUJ16_00885 [Kangiella sp.]|nr:hypothetical protein [Kangiella sp.]
MADPITDIKLIMQVLSLLASLGEAPAGSPPQQAEMQMPTSLADVGREIVKCYHPTARFHSVDILQRPWNRQAYYNADKSVLLRVHWRGGLVGRRYALDVALLSKGNQLRAPVQHDNALTRPSTRCMLNNWTQVKGLSAPTGTQEAGAISDRRSVKKVLSDLIMAAEAVSAGGPEIKGGYEAIPKERLEKLRERLRAVKEMAGQ